MFTNSFRTSEKMADFLWKQQETTLNNMANISTPGFKAQYMSFEEELKKNLENANENSMSSLRKAIDDTSIRLHTKEDESYRLDGNNVNLDVEQAQLASVSIQYQYAIKSINDEFTKLRSVIR